jgi:mannose-6-phosphate isomerase
VVSVPSRSARAGEPAVRPLIGRLRDYSWGSPTAIYELLGVPPSGRPGAELWLGTHPAAPAEVETGDGRRPAAEWVGTLPFLLKVLAAETPLSLQVHPTREQAEAGFAADERAGIPLDASHRRYRDRNHKPELIVALTPFRALAGIRDPATTLAVVAALGGAAARDVFAPLAEPGGAAKVLRSLLTLPADAGAALAETFTAAAAGASAGDDDVGRAADLIGTLAPIYPGDVGIAVALLLNDITIAPGDGLFQPARMPHSYVHGVGIEIMAASDNVLRGGLTPKHIDVPELLAVLDPTPAPPPIVRPRTLLEAAGGRLRGWDVPVDDFTLREAECRGELTVTAATILLVTEGEIAVTPAGAPLADPLTLARGQAAAVSGAGELILRGHGRVFLAGAG